MSTATRVLPLDARLTVLELPEDEMADALVKVVSPSGAVELASTVTPVAVHVGVTLTLVVPCGTDAV